MSATAKLPNFSRADEAMQAAETFFLRASDICSRNANTTQDLVDRMFLEHAARRTKRLADALGDQRRGPDSAAHQTFVQYAPSEPVPDKQALAGLEREGLTASSALDHLAESCRGWSHIFEHFRASAATEQEQELQAACIQLLDTYRRDLVAAFQQREQL